MADVPRRIVSLTPSNTEVLWVLGATDRIVGVDDHSDFPEELDELGVARVGPDLRIDIEAVAALKPDLVLASRSVPGMERVVEGIEEAGLPSLVLAPKTIDQVLDDHLKVGALLGLETKAQRVVSALRTRFDSVRAMTQRREPLRVLWEWWPKPLVSAGGGSWMTEIIEIAGGVNVMGATPEESPVVPQEDVPVLVPEVVAACWCGTLQRVVANAPRVIASRPAFKDTPAVREGRLLALDECYYGRPGPRLAEGAHLLAHHLHPSFVPHPSEGALPEAPL